MIVNHFIGFLTEYGIGLPDYKTMDDADKYFQVQCMADEVVAPYLALFYATTVMVGMGVQTLCPKDRKFTQLVSCCAEMLTCTVYRDLGPRFGTTMAQ